MVARFARSSRSTEQEMIEFALSSRGLYVRCRFIHKTLVYTLILIRLWQHFS